MNNGKQNKNQSKEITGLHILTLDMVEYYFLLKATKEKKLNRILTEKEAIELLMTVKKKENFTSIYVEGKKENVRAVLGEHFDIMNPKKREDK